MYQEIKDLFNELREILVAENERHWIRGITEICSALSDDSMRVEGDKFEEVKLVYGAMCRGAGSFSDFYIHREDFDERVKSNERLDQIRHRLWDLLF